MKIQGFWFHVALASLIGVSLGCRSGALELNGPEQTQRASPPAARNPGQACSIDAPVDLAATSVRSMVVSPTGAHVAIIDEQSALLVVEIATQRKHHLQSRGEFHFSSDGRFVFAIVDDSAFVPILLAYDLRSGERHILASVVDALRFVVAPTGASVVVATMTEVFSYDAATKQRLSLSDKPGCRFGIFDEPSECTPIVFADDGSVTFLADVHESAVTNIMVGTLAVSQLVDAQTTFIATEVDDFVVAPTGRARLYSHDLRWTTEEDNEDSGSLSRSLSAIHKSATAPWSLASESIAGLRQEAALSPDGERVAFVPYATNDTSLHLRRAIDGQPIHVWRSAAPGAPHFWSNDRLVFWRWGADPQDLFERDLVTTAIASDELQVLATQPGNWNFNPPFVAWRSPQGNTVWGYQEQSGTVRALGHAVVPEGASEIRFSPSGLFALVMTYQGEVIADFASGVVRNLSPARIDSSTWLDNSVAFISKDEFSLYDLVGAQTTFSSPAQRFALVGGSCAGVVLADPCTRTPSICESPGKVTFVPRSSME